ncbi:hypothetical protein J6590_026791 [Homalodisca vitripennis]|nr:hypothetical protein J6590_026791 [Homalodisca vitripennis]
MSAICKVLTTEVKDRNSTRLTTLKNDTDQTKTDTPTQVRPLSTLDDLLNLLPIGISQTFSSACFFSFFSPLGILFDESEQQTAGPGRGVATQVTQGELFLPPGAVAMAMTALVLQPTSLTHHTPTDTPLLSAERLPFTF